MCFSAYFGKRISKFLLEMDIPSLPGVVSAGQLDLWNCSLLGDAHHWPSDSRSWCCWFVFWWPCAGVVHSSTQSPSRCLCTIENIGKGSNSIQKLTSTSLHWDCILCLSDREYCWSTGRRRFNAACNLERV
jgi:hypothetical protein